MATRKTDSSYFADKVALRINHLPDLAVIRVLDSFCGYGCVWDAVRRRVAEKRISVTGIDTRDLGDLVGDNRKWLAGMDLSIFHVIDLDAYGFPVEQLEILARRQFRGMIFATFCRTGMGQVPFSLLQGCGFSGAMLDASPVLCARAADLVETFLYGLGVRRFWKRESSLGQSRRLYCAFQFDQSCQ